MYVINSKSVIQLLWIARGIFRKSPQRQCTTVDNHKLLTEAAAEYSQTSATWWWWWWNCLF